MYSYIEHLLSRIAFYPAGFLIDKQNIAFKVMDDPFVGSLTFCRIYSGKLDSGVSVMNTVKEKRERIGRMLLMHSNNREDIKAELKVDLIMLLAENGYPPITHDDVYKEIFEQAQNFKKYRNEARG